MAELMPPAEREVPPQTLAAIRRSLLVSAVPSRRRLPSRRIVVALALAFAAAAGATAYALVSATGEQVTNAVVCHNEPRLDSSVSGILAADGRDPVTICAQALAVPGSALVACANPAHGQLEVFPSRDPGICERLELGPVPADYRREAARFAAMTDDLVGRLGRTCWTDSQARVIARRVLDRHGYRDWRIELGAPWPGRPCRNEIATSPQDKTLTLVAAPRGG